MQCVWECVIVDGRFEMCVDSNQISPGRLNVGLSMKSETEVDHNTDPQWIVRVSLIAASLAQSLARFLRIWHDVAGRRGVSDVAKQGFEKCTRVVKTIKRSTVGPLLFPRSG
jgi:hypothetical protein